MGLKTNQTPFTDVVKLISPTVTADSEGYDVAGAPVEAEVFCSFFDGVNRTDFYEGLKAGFQLSATVEVWEDDYSGQPLVLKSDTTPATTYRVRRTWPTGHGTIYLYLEEVIR